MAYQVPLDELAVVNRALSATGDNQVAQADDGSDEWNTCDPAYQAGLGYAAESHSWGFAKQVLTLTASPAAMPQAIANPGGMARFSARKPAASA